MNDISTLTAATSNDPALWWVAPAIGILSALTAGGGVVAWRRLGLDRRLGVSAAEVSEEDALSGRWERIIETQTEALVEPLRTRLAEVTVELAGLRQQVRDCETEVNRHRSRYWRAIGYARTLLTWIRARTQITDEPPAPPADIAEDI